MSLASGTKLGPYEIAAPLGAGGMGEVYRAKDTRLGRDVAVKVLPQHLTSNAEVRARFEREARTVSGLNHPHICVLHDVGREGDADYLVMELVEGETLAHRLARGPLPAVEVVRLGAQIADALDRAHRAGVVHRDLKPGNVMLSKSGLKLMDFGLARATGLAGPAGSGATMSALTQSPTVAAPLTAEGTIVGTFQYMAPEQLEGKEADARADLWALGCVLYEMATGRRAFDGATQASLISAIMRDAPRPMAELAPMSPPALERLVSRCLAKDPDDRWQTARDLMHELRALGEASSGAAAAPTGASATAAAKARAPRGHGAALAWGVAAVAALAALGLGAALVLGDRDGVGPVTAAVPPPPGVTFSSYDVTPVPLAISPDGSHIAFCAHEGNGPDRLWVRSLATADARALPGTEGAALPFFSPDGRAIAFFADGMLRRVPVDGGPVTVIAEARDPRGGSWGRKGFIVFAPRGTAGLSVVGEDGGPVRPVTALDSTVHEATHRNPHFLPDGVHFLYLARRAGAGRGEEPTIFAASIESPGRTRVLGVASNVAYASGHLLYVEGGNLVAQAFDPGRRAVRGPAIAISGTVSMDERFSRATFAASQNGVLVFRTGTATIQSRLRWLERSGAVLRDVGEPGHYTFGGQPRIDPSGRWSVTPMLSAERGVSDAWIVDLVTGRRRRLSVDDNDHYSATWSADGARVFANTIRKDRGYEVISMAADGSGGTRSVWRYPDYVYVESPSPDGRWLLVSVADSSGAFDVLALSLADAGRVVPVATGEGDQNTPWFSPDGRFVAYTSNESGREEAYVAAFPATGGKWQATPKGGRQPRWSRDGRELFFLDGENYLNAMAVTRAGAGLEFGAPQRLFQIYGSFGPDVRYDVAPDGQRLLVSSDAAEGPPPPLTLITDWPRTLER